MNDVIVIVIVLGFFALAAAYVGWCDRIASASGPEPPEQRDRDAPDGRTVAAVGTREVRS